MTSMKTAHPMRSSQALLTRYLGFFIWANWELGTTGSLGTPWTQHPPVRSPDVNEHVRLLGDFVTVFAPQNMRRFEPIIPSMSPERVFTVTPLGQHDLLPPPAEGSGI